jgi:glycosyltransferase involved in cell wall biosynthesis
LLNDRESANRMGLAGRTRVENEFSWPIVGKRLAGILTEAAGERLNGLRATSDAR